MLSSYLGPARVVVALLLPGAGFLLVELIVEPAALSAALPGLLILAVFYGAAVCTVVILRRRGVRPPGFRALLGWAALLVAVDQML